MPPVIVVRRRPRSALTLSRPTPMIPAPNRRTILTDDQRDAARRLAHDWQAARFADPNRPSPIQAPDPAMQQARQRYLAALATVPPHIAQELVAFCCHRTTAMPSSPALAAMLRHGLDRLANHYRPVAGPACRQRASGSGGAQA